jgi:hypothetical protein
MCRNGNRNFESPFPPARGRPLACPSRPHARHVGAGPGAEPNRSTEPNRSALQQRRGGCRDRSEFKNRTELQENRTVRDPIGRRGIPATSRVASRDPRIVEVDETKIPRLNSQEQVSCQDTTQRGRTRPRTTGARGARVRLLLASGRTTVVTVIRVAIFFNYFFQERTMGAEWKIDNRIDNQSIVRSR